MSTPRRAFAARRKALGYTQEEFAVAVRIRDFRTVGRWEQGENTPHPRRRARIAEVLKVTLDELDALLHPEIASGEAPWKRAVDVWNALEPDDRTHVTAAMKDPYSTFGTRTLHCFDRQVSAHMTNDGADGPIGILPAITELLAAVERCALDVPAEIRGQLMAVGARGAEFAGWLCRDVRELDSASLWYGRAMEWAHEARDFPMVGYILLRKSQMAFDDRDARRVLALAQAANAGPWQLPVRVRTEVIQQEARGLAMTGASLDVVERKLDEACQLLTGSTSDRAGLGSSYDDSTLRLRSASCYVEAGKPGRAADLYREVLDTNVLSRRDSGYFTARMASALALAGEPDEAANVGLRAAETAVATASKRTSRELRRALVTLERWNKRPGIRQLEEAVRQGI
ncbi:helix-turn-helix transcriptional regulator [Kibdelosporangium lantanae]|uniref:Helix-turn-helix transcriptional regulator n=1 Tax=Kibdelosporangium lantanae TaxID=1497396 RepID=A0ABW3M3M9_9PSEU